ncbi:MAG: polyphosphate polymerase domain-containing protein [Oscillospiraceae bacterium]|nr:polyphosphate polymerase domain-containing protein [Oscillospiraceae bacterium]
MARHEEKYIISYAQYVLLKQRAMLALTPDSHGTEGSYTIASLYYDDPQDTALDEKRDGLALHRKFRVRAYDGSDRFIKLERKDKQGIMTVKWAAPIRREQIGMLTRGETDLQQLSGDARALAAQMAATGLAPAVVVRYKRDAFYHAGSDLRLTFDRELQALPPDADALFDLALPGIPVLDGNSVIMEIKYGSRIPGFVRRLTAVNCRQLSVSKYALCREMYR